MMRRILVVDDDPLALQLLVAPFQYGSTVCDNTDDPTVGLANIRKASRNGRPYDVAILDFVFASKGGNLIDEEMCHEIRALMPRCLIIHVTSEFRHKQVRSHRDLAQLKSPSLCMTVDKDKEGGMSAWTGEVLDSARRHFYTDRVSGLLDSLVGRTAPGYEYPFSASHVLLELQLALEQGYQFVDEATLERLAQFVAWPTAQGQFGISFRGPFRRELTA